MEALLVLVLMLSILVLVVGGLKVRLALLKVLMAAQPSEASGIIRQPSRS